MEYIELLESATLDSVPPETITEEIDDTTPLSRAEIAQKLFENKAFSILNDNKMKAGYFCDSKEGREAIAQLRSMIGDAMEADRILSDFFAIHNHLFT